MLLKEMGKNKIMVIDLFNHKQYSPVFQKAQEHWDDNRQYWTSYSMLCFSCMLFHRMLISQSPSHRAMSQGGHLSHRCLIKDRERSATDPCPQIWKARGYDGYEGQVSQVKSPNWEPDSLLFFAILSLAGTVTSSKALNSAFWFPYWQNDEVRQADSQGPV